jgi:hypothetical protein
MITSVRTANAAVSRTNVVFVVVVVVELECRGQRVAELESGIDSSSMLGARGPEGAVTARGEGTGHLRAIARGV